MAKDLSRHQQGIVKRYYEHQETIHANKLSEIVSELYVASGESARVRLWGRAQTALMRSGVDARQAAKIAGARDLEALAKLVAQVDAGAVPDHIRDGAAAAAPGPAAEQEEAPAEDPLSEDNLKRALKAFRRKIKTIRRDDESRLGNRYVTSGRESAICAVQPPSEFPPEVWKKLAELGRLKHAGQGTYQLP